MTASRELVALQSKRYLPEFDITSGTCSDRRLFACRDFCVDGNPSDKIEYTCPCKGYKFNTLPKYNQHIKCARHREWLIEYAGEQKAMNNREKEWRIKEHKLQRQLDAARKELHKDDVYRAQQKELLQIKQELRIEQAKNCEAQMRELELKSTILDLRDKISSLGDDDEDWQDAVAPA